MTVQEFIQHIGENSPSLIYLFCPSKAPRAREATFEPYLAERAVELFCDTYVQPETKDLAYAALYADETKPADVVMEAQTMPFLTERRVMLVRQAEKYNTEAADGPLISYLESPNETTVLLLIASRIDKRTKFFKACKKSGEIVECPEMNEREISDWIRGEIKTRDKKIEPAAIQEIIGRTGTHLSDVNNALTIVTTYVGEGEVIREEDVVAACADVAEEEIWALTDAIAASNAGKALVSLRRLIELGKHPDELMGIINWLLNSAYAVAIAGAGQPKISPFVARKVTPLAEKLGINKLRAAFALCTDTHFMLRTTGVDSNLAMELLVVKLAVPRRKSKSA